MLTLLNTYLHGVVSVPVIMALKDRGVFSLLDVESGSSLELICSETGANTGHLRVALYLLQSLGWVAEKSNKTYHRTGAGACIDGIPENAAELLFFPYDEYLVQEHRALSLSGWITRSGDRWGSDDTLVGDFMDGLLAVPLLLALDRQGCLKHWKKDGFRIEGVLPQVVEEVLALFVQLEWIEVGSNRPTALGQFFVDRRHNLSIVMSYLPLLQGLTELLFGDCEAMFRTDADGHEGHVNRSLNVLGSGAQHDLSLIHI